MFSLKISGNILCGIARIHERAVLYFERGIGRRAMAQKYNNTSEIKTIVPARAGRGYILIFFLSL